SGFRCLPIQAIEYEYEYEYRPPRRTEYEKAGNQRLSSKFPNSRKMKFLAFLEDWCAKPVMSTSL
ncbi:MAG: hypothetical protein ACOVNQ_14560, partial [Pirellula sp.]